MKKILDEMLEIFHLFNVRVRYDILCANYKILTWCYPSPPTISALYESNAIISIVST